VFGVEEAFQCVAAGDFGVELSVSAGEREHVGAGGLATGEGEETDLIVHGLKDVADGPITDPVAEIRVNLRHSLARSGMECESLASKREPR